jgi:hypothetical protein
MRALSVAAVMVACAPASADPAAFRVGLLCDGTLPVAIQVVALQPGTITLLMADAFDACVSELKESKRWRARS